MNPLERGSGEEINLDPRLAKLRSAQRYWQREKPSLAESGLFEFLTQYSIQHPDSRIHYPAEESSSLLQMEGLKKHFAGLATLSRVELTFITDDLIVQAYEVGFVGRSPIFSPFDTITIDFKDKVKKAEMRTGLTVLTVRDALIVAGLYHHEVITTPKITSEGPTLLGDSLLNRRPPLLGPGRNQE